MEILFLGFWSQGPRELDLRSNQGFKECPRQSALCYTWCSHCLLGAMSWLCGWMNERVRAAAIACLSHLQLQVAVAAARPAFVAS